MNADEVPYRNYWYIWTVLLVVTLAMMAVEAARFPAILGLLILVGAMFIKATFIAGWFMHLKFERRVLVLSLVLGTLLTAAFLFFLIAVDAYWISRPVP